MADLCRDRVAARFFDGNVQPASQDDCSRHHLISGCLFGRLRLSGQAMLVDQAMPTANQTIDWNQLPSTHNQDIPNLELSKWNFDLAVVHQNPHKPRLLPQDTDQLLVRPILRNKDQLFSDKKNHRPHTASQVKTTQPGPQQADRRQHRNLQLPFIKQRAIRSFERNKRRIDGQRKTDQNNRDDRPPSHQGCSHNHNRRTQAPIQRLFIVAGDRTDPFCTSCHFVHLLETGGTKDRVQMLFHQPLVLIVQNAEELRHARPHFVLNSRSRLDRARPRPPQQRCGQRLALEKQTSLLARRRLPARLCSWHLRVSQSQKKFCMRSFHEKFRYPVTSSKRCGAASTISLLLGQTVCQQVDAQHQ